jgi:molybdopterin biosynthesis enzyme
VRVRLVAGEGEPLAEPVFGQPGLLRSLIHSDGLVRIPRDAEGLDAGAAVDVLLFP